jgi:hypothetical protein
MAKFAGQPKAVVQDGSYHSVVVILAVLHIAVQTFHLGEQI